MITINLKTYLLVAILSFALIVPNFANGNDNTSRPITLSDIDMMVVDYGNSQNLMGSSYSRSLSSGEYYDMDAGTGWYPPTREGLISMMDSIAIVDGPSNNLQNGVSIDLSDDPYFPAVGNQGSLNSCVGWAVSYYAGTYMFAKQNSWNVKESDSGKVFNPLWVYTKVNQGLNQGTYYTDIMKIATRIGFVPYENMATTYTTSNWGDEDDWMVSSQYRISNYEVTSTTNTAVIKGWLDDGYVVIFPIYSGDYNYFNGDAILSNAEDSGNLQDHAQVIVGYDDTITDDGDIGAFKAINSWGSTWGPNGDGSYYITYSALANLNYKWCWRLNDPVYSVGESPEMLAKIQLDSSNLGSKDQIIKVGIGTSSSPSGQVNLFDSLQLNGGTGSLPSIMVFDVTDWSSSFDTSLSSTGKGEYFCSFSGGTSSSTVEEFGIIRYDGSQNVLYNTVNTYACDASIVNKFYSTSQPLFIDKTAVVANSEVQFSATVSDIDNDVWAVKLYPTETGVFLTESGGVWTYNLDVSTYEIGTYTYDIKIYDGSGNIYMDTISFELTAEDFPEEDPEIPEEPQNPEELTTNISFVTSVNISSNSIAYSGSNKLVTTTFVSGLNIVLPDVGIPINFSDENYGTIIMANNMSDSLNLEWNNMSDEEKLTQLSGIEIYPIINYGFLTSNMTSNLTENGFSLSFSAINISSEHVVVLRIPVGNMNIDAVLKDGVALPNSQTSNSMGWYKLYGSGTSKVLEITLLEDPEIEIVGSFPSGTTLSTSSTGNIYENEVWLNTPDGKFSLIVITDVDGSCSGDSPVINKGDVVAIALNTTNMDIEARKSIGGKLLVESRLSKTFSFNTPTVFDRPIINLY